MKPTNEISRPQDTPETAAHDTAEPITAHGFLKPFVPRWLDELGLRPIPFRVYAHLWRRGESFSTAATIAEACRIKRDTVFVALAELEDAGLIRKQTRKGMTSLIQPVPPNGATPKEGTPTQTGRDVSPQTGRHPSPQTGLKGYPSKDIPKRVSNSKKPSGFEPTIEESQFASWFKSSLPQDQQDRLPRNWQETYAKAFRDLVKLDKRDPDEIRRVCQWARTDPFWSPNFRSPTKLRDRDKQGSLYFDVFVEKMKPTTQKTTTTRKINTANRPSEIEEL